MVLWSTQNPNTSVRKNSTQASGMIFLVLTRQFVDCTDIPQGLSLTANNRGDYFIFKDEPDGNHPDLCTV